MKLQGSTHFTNSSGKGALLCGLNCSVASSVMRAEVGEGVLEERTDSTLALHIDIGRSKDVLSSRRGTLGVAAQNSNSNNERDSRNATTPTSLMSDTDSIKTFGSERTLVETGSEEVVLLTQRRESHEETILRVQREVLNLSATQHKHTASSLGSEGYGSLTSEEIGPEEPSVQDLSQWSKEVGSE